MIKYIIKSFRPKQWTKNLFVFAGIVFSKNIFNIDYLEKVIFAYILFCFASSGIYILNDIFDLPHDKLHPIKRNRPIASGKIPLSLAWVLAIILFTISIAFSFYLSISLGYVILAYIVSHIAYSLYLKRVVILDLLIVALGFVLRVVAGSVIIDVRISSWLFVCTALLSLFLILAKRRQEIISVPDGESRPVLNEYNLGFIDQIISAVAASTITSYFLYAFSSETVAKYGSDRIAFSIPFVLYGVLRYLYLVHKRQLGEEPEKILLTDKPFIINLVCWVVSVFLAVYV